MPKKKKNANFELELNVENKIKEIEIFKLTRNFFKDYIYS